MISITRLLELKKDLTLEKQVLRISSGIDCSREMTDTLRRLGAYTDILEDYLRIQQGSA